MSDIHEKKKKPLEGIDHHTAARPFGIYNISIAEEEPCALYMHCHEEAEFFYLETGELDFVVEDAHYHLRSGEGIFVPPMLIHGAYKDTGHRCLFTAVVFSPDLISASFDSYRYTAAVLTARMSCVFPFYKSNSRYEIIKGVMTLFPRETEYEISQNELSIVGGLYIIWQELYNQCFSKLDENALSNELHGVILYLQKHFDEDLTLAQMARESGFSESYFGHFFTENMGMPPFAYLNKIRIANAGNLLSTTDKSIAEIASLSGFGNISYFNRTFLKIMGLTPSAFRAGHSLFP